MINTTEKELNQLHYINKEIEVLKNQLDELKSRSVIKGQEITGMPFVTGTSDKTAAFALAIREVEELYEIKLRELYVVRGRIERYINTVEDPEMRLIIRLRCINNLSWEQIAAETMILDADGNVTKERHRTSVYRRFKNFLKISETAHIAHC